MAKGISTTFKFLDDEANKSIADITKSVKLLNSNLSVVNETLKGSSASTQDYQNKITSLTDRQKELEEKLRIMKKGLEDNSNAFGENSDEALKLKVAIANTERELVKTTNEIDNTKESMKGASKETSIFGDVLKANLVSEAIIGGIKAIGSAVKQIGSAFFDVGKQAIQSYADYEQLIGGVETLFGDSSKIVENYANNAYKTAGLGANEYMETVTSFSASLLQSLNGDTAKSAKVADMAITDMADNANKMGTSMESIQNAYQGFAKQNYTMLDNLKLGYGGTKTEMERLLSDATKISGVKYDISNLKDVYSAIHVVQTELGITGTTAKEASQTISGSVSAMKSSWSNLLTGLASGDADLTGLISNVIDSALTVADNILPVIEQVSSSILEVLPTLLNSIIENLPKFLESGSNILTSIITGLQSNMSSIMSAVMQIINMLITTIVQNLPQIIQMGIQMLVSLIQGIAKSLPSLIPTIIDAVMLIVTTLLENIDLIIDTGISLLFGLIDGLINAIPNLIESIPKIVEALVEALVAGIPKIVATAPIIIMALARAIVTAIPSLVYEVPKIIGAVVNGLLDGLYKIKDVGINMVKGLWEGMKNTTDWLLNKIKSFASSITDGIKSFFGIHSPSKVFEDEIGLNLGLGLAKGITDSISAVQNAMSDLGQATLNTVEPTLNVNTLNPFENQDLFGRIETNPNAYQINFYPQNLSEQELEVAFNYVNRKFGVEI